MADKERKRNPYAEHQPFVRSRVDKNGYRYGPSTIERENAILVRKLKEIKLKPSVVVPCGNSALLGSSGDRAQAPWECFKQHAVHTPSSGKSPQKARAEEIGRVNVILGRQLQERYAVRKDSVVVQNHLGQGIDCNQRWQQRTNIYSSTGGSKSSETCGYSNSSRPSSAQAVFRRSAAIKGGHSRPGSAGSGTQDAARGRTNGVPKTLGVASCAGCGRRSFFNADGVHLKPCPACKQVYYCSKLCAHVDQASHKALCRYYVTGQWTPAGIRAAADCWVVSKSMAVARKLLRQQHSHNILGTARPSTAPGTGGIRTSATCNSSKWGERWSAVEQLDTVFEVRRAAIDEWGAQLNLQDRLEQKLAAVRLQEQQEERRQQQIEQYANAGMAGPRPCLCVNGSEMGDHVSQGKQLHKRSNQHRS